VSLLDRINARSARTGDAGRKAEVKTAKRVGGDLTPASGAMDGAKGDFTLPDLLIENKSTTSDSFSVKYEHLQKISQEARAVGRAPALFFQFTRRDGTPHPSGKWVCIPEHIWEEMQDAED